MKTSYYKVLVFFAVALSYSCQDADDFFGDQKANPEIDYSQQYAYLPSYVIGDTMTITGRLNPESGLTIQIGDANALIVKTLKIPYGTGTTQGQSTLDQVKFVITKSMGIGTNRTVTISTGGYKAIGTPIEIMAINDVGNVADTLEFVSYFSLPENSLTFYCKSGDGAVYFYHFQEQTIKRVEPDGSVNTVFSLNNLNDAAGDFEIRQFYSGGVDPLQKVLYFSAKTNEEGQQDKKIFRLCKVDIQSGTMTTLNRTEILKDSTQLTVDHYKPFEGNIGQIKMLGADGIFPDSQGGLYLTLRIDYSGFMFSNIVQPYALVALDRGGNLKYLLKEGDGELQGFAITPMIWSEEYQLALGLETFNRILPGTGVISLFEASASSSSGPPGNRFKFAIAPDDKIAYFVRFARKVGLFEYDLESHGVVNQVTKYLDNSSMNPVHTGSFASPNFYLPNSYESGGSFDTMADYFLLPLPGEKVLFFGPVNSYASSDFRFYVEDFVTSRAYPYAPGSVKNYGTPDEDGNYLDLSYSKVPNELLGFEVHYDTDLNYDKNGMLYVVMGRYSTNAVDEFDRPIRLESVLVKTKRVQ